jgi:hypothetical protein
MPVNMLATDRVANDREKVIWDKIARLLRTDDGKLLLEKVDNRHKWHIKNLQVAHDLIEIGREQGRLEILEWLLTMRED